MSNPHIEVECNRTASKLTCPIDVVVGHKYQYVVIKKNLKDGEVNLNLDSIKNENFSFQKFGQNFSSLL